MDSGWGTTGGGSEYQSRSPFWRTPEESCQGLGSVSLKKETLDTHSDTLRLRLREERVCVCVVCGVCNIDSLRHHSIWPSKQPFMVRTFLKAYMELGSYFVSARTNKRHHHHS